MANLDKSKELIEAMLDSAGLTNTKVTIVPNFGYATLFTSAEENALSIGLVSCSPIFGICPTELTGEVGRRIDSLKSQINGVDKT